MTPTQIAVLVRLGLKVGKAVIEGIPSSPESDAARAARIDREEGERREEEESKRKEELAIAAFKHDHPIRYFSCRLYCACLLPCFTVLRVLSGLLSVGGLLYLGMAVSVTCFVYGPSPVTWAHWLIAVALSAAFPLVAMIQVAVESVMVGNAAPD